jgi:hypothetical protein
VRKLDAATGGSFGMVSICTVSATAPTTAERAKAARQPHRSPIYAPIGAAQTVATETPVSDIDIARGTNRVGTSRMVKAPAIDQKPPSPIPKSTRASRRVVSPVAVAARMLDRTSSSVSVHSTSLRSMFLVKIASVSPAMPPTIAVAVTVWPAAPSVTLRSFAIRVSRLAGRNSAVTRPNTPETEK